MYKNPYRVITGVAMLAMSAYAAQYVFAYHAALLSAHRIAIIAGGILAVI